MAGVPFWADRLMAGASTITIVQYIEV